MNEATNRKTALIVLCLNLVTVEYLQPVLCFKVIVALFISQVEEKKAK